MAQAATVQFNVRIDRELKEEGDALLARMGVSPAQAVRAVWSRLASIARLPHPDKAARELLFPPSEQELKERDELLAKRLAALEEGEKISQRIAELLGSYATTIANTPYDELKEMALMDKWGE